MSILTLAYFDSGYYRISQQSDTATELQAYIDRFEAEYLAKLFGVDLYTLFNADLSSGVPQTARFLTVFNAFQRANESAGTFYISGHNPIYCGHPRTSQPTVIISKGIKDMLAGFIYFDFMRDLQLRATPLGLKQPESETTTNFNARASQRISAAWNAAVDSYTAIQWLMCESEGAGDYPEYDGQPIKKIFMGGAI